MKVLKKGSGAKGWSKKVKCTGKGNEGGGCGATLLVEKGDLFRTHHYDYGGGHDTYVTIRCPECKVLTDIDDVPYSVQEDIPDSEPKDKGPK